MISGENNINDQVGYKYTGANLYHSRCKKCFEQGKKKLN